MLWERGFVKYIKTRVVGYKWRFYSYNFKITITIIDRWKPKHSTSNHLVLFLSTKAANYFINKYNFISESSRSSN